MYFSSPHLVSRGACVHQCKTVTGSATAAVVTLKDDNTLEGINLGDSGFAVIRDGKLVLRDPGLIRFEFLVDHNGTPSDPSDDVEVPDSFAIVKGSTGLNETEGRDFCEDILLFTS